VFHEKEEVPPKVQTYKKFFYGSTTKVPLSPLTFSASFFSGSITFVVGHITRIFDRKPANLIKLLSKLSPIFLLAYLFIYVHVF